MLEIDEGVRDGWGVVFARLIEIDGVLVFTRLIEIDGVFARLTGC